MAPAGAHAAVLAPIPEGYSGPVPEWRGEFANRPLVYSAGFLWPEQGRLLSALARTLAAAGARLVVLGRKTPEVEALLAANLADHIPAFAENTAALAHLAQHAAGLLVSYAATTEELPWSRTSMPSKLVEFSHLGLPIALVAPGDTAIAGWARSLDISSSYSPQDAAGLTTWAQGLKGPTTWLQLVDIWRPLAAGAWKPSTIHEQLSNGLLR
jgi:hypothetical protein